MSKDYGAKQAVGRKSKTTNQWVLILLGFLLGYLSASFLSIETLSHWMNSQVLAYHEAKPEATPVVTKKSHSSAKPKFEFYTLLSKEKGPAHQAQSNSIEQPAENKLQTIASAADPQAGTTKASDLIKPNAPQASVTHSDRPHSITALASKLSSGPALGRRDKSRSDSSALNRLSSPAEQAKASKDKGVFQIQVASFKARQDAEHMKALLTLKGYEVSVASISNPTGNWFRVLIGPYPNRSLAQKAQVVLTRSEGLNGMVRSVGG